MHYVIGNLGHLFVIVSFVTALASAFSYWKVDSSHDLINQKAWLANARVAFITHGISVLGIVITLFIIIYSHYFEYHYAYSHSSLHLPPQYMVSCFWEGQEGSFLLWMFWQMVLGLILIRTQRHWEAPMMVVFATVQAFLASMILGVVIPGIDLKLGSSPFILLRDAIADPIFTLHPDFIPKDGNGLNPLLQNYWMVIHPPTLFLGFALTLVPFAFCIAGLWKKKYTEWIVPALPWSLVGGAILGTGILMGGIWAYETLSFGGYWNWDPVENAVYVPWLVLIASIHTMMTRQQATSLKSAIILVISVFILILYSTFLTRSGILGDASVHSFTDLGLSGQLLVYLAFFTIASTYLLIRRWKELPSAEKEVSVYSREFWIFLGAITLCLMGFQVLIPTSIPVYNRVMDLFGVVSNLAPPADQIKFYSKFQMWFGIAVAVISGTGQFFWWKKIDKETWRTEMTPTLLITLIIWTIFLIITKLQPVYMALSFAGVYIITSNIRVLIRIFRAQPQLSGGAIAHIGIGLILLGILFSAGYSKIVSLNTTGLIYIKEAGTEFNRDNLLLFLNEPRKMADYDIEYLGERVEPRHKSGFVRKNDLEPTLDPYKVVARKDIVFKGEKLYDAKDTFEVNPENTFYEIQLRKNNHVAATLFPRVQINPAMGGFIASPDISRQLLRDLYTHVSAPMDATAQVDWGKPEEVRVRIGQKFFVNDYVAVMESVERVDEVAGVPLTANDVAVKAKIRIEGEHDTYISAPVFLIRDRSQVGRIPDEVSDLGIRITLTGIHPETNEFTFELNARQKDWVIIKALEKPYINVLWLGASILLIGFFVAARTRIKQFRKMTD
jgi:cytochrome c-type biogenesis protein CcmF